MPPAFSRLRIAGFKSFAEPATLEIRPGLTGIVGPNGCGKSNVVEALRWAMGESSAKSLRGGDMDDVVFAGTLQRPARNLAEVALTLDGAEQALPAPFESQAELEVSRRIMRGSGSQFRINGKEARARDVQTLFADLGSGARSSAMVSQGRVGALVGARPDERGAILEEAAGIGGLHSRRHEAELKLRAAETNMERAEDLRTQLTTQIAALARQARQAKRYRDLSGLIRTAQADLLGVQRARTQAARDAAQARLGMCTTTLAAAAAEAAVVAEAAETLTAALPALREVHGASRTTLERCRIAHERIEGEQAAARAALAEVQEALRRVERDRIHADQLSREAAQAEQRLTAEAAGLADEAGDHPERAGVAATTLAACVARLREVDAAVHEATTTLAALVERRQALNDLRSTVEARADQLERAWRGLVQDRGAVQPVDPAQLDAATTAVMQAETRVERAATMLETAESSRVAAVATHDAARARLHETEPVCVRLRAEQQALIDTLAVHAPAQTAPLVDELNVPEGLEAAIGAVLGDLLELATDPGAPTFVRPLPALEPCPALPVGTAPLKNLIEAPAVLMRVLSQIGLVEAADHAAALQPGLVAGQVLVGRDGAVWRWDGYVQRAGAPTAAAVRLQQRNRLSELRGALLAAEAAQAEACAANDAAWGIERAAIAAETAARAERRAADQIRERDRHALHDLRGRADRDAVRLAALDAQIGRLATERTLIAAERAQAETARAALPALDAAHQAVQDVRAAQGAARSGEHTARAALDALRQQASARNARQAVLLTERRGWSDRARDAALRITDLTARWDEAQSRLAELKAQPDRLTAAQQAAIAALNDAEALHRARAQQLGAAESAAVAADRADRAAAAALAGAREAVLRGEADCRDADQAWATLRDRIAERLGPDADLPRPADLSDEAEERARRRQQRLVGEREEMGPVNLRAEIEVGEIETRLAAIDHERAELTAAITKLRGSIGHLNREGRERLTEVFAQVDRHFQALFVRMFGGGRAQLALVGSDDPLLAGLEIYAQPPGKKLATLSLLSGGEQALTALSLIFAVFCCNPAPVCVLDEVDAPLDDANIDRFCALLSDMVAQTGTRFLVVTHHHLTMARMDRLYGVTMQERGVSRLLSVDLARAAALVDPVSIAAE